MINKFKEMKRINLISGLLLFGLIFSSCNKESEKSYPFSVRMTDNPAPYSAVNIDLKEVIVKGNDDVEITFTDAAGIIDLLELSNGNNVLLATGSLNTDSIQQIRLVLGPENTIVVDGETHDLSTPSAEQSGLKLQVHQALEPGVNYEIMLDFDANKSIVKTGNGGYKLKPVIRTINTATSGAIRGNITPVGTVASVTAESGGETYSSNVDSDGNFLIMGLPEGTYSLTVTPEEPLNPSTLEGLEVTIGSTTDAGTITLE